VQRAADHLLELGLVAVSLRELAVAVGVSPRMLVHHFSSREELMSCALREARSRQRAAFEARLAPQTGRPNAEVLTDAWRWLGPMMPSLTYACSGSCTPSRGAPDSVHAAFLREISAGLAADHRGRLRR
jgi:AcrR family transcriptional regulator